MPGSVSSGDGTITLAELREFASFSAGSQRYIRRSLDVAYARSDAIQLWSRDKREAASIAAQSRLYAALPMIRTTIPDDCGLDALAAFIGPLTVIAAFDLGQERIDGFGPFRFLYERLLGAPVRPWLPSAFCAAAALPQIQPSRRKQLLHSISEAAATAPGWSDREPCFFPEFIEKEAA